MIVFFVSSIGLLKLKIKKKKILEIIILSLGFRLGKFCDSGLP